LLIDHGRFFVVVKFMILEFPWALDTIASKPEHDKVTCRRGLSRDLNGGGWIAIVWADGSPRTEISP
jgi:hypothetical protein